MSGPYPNLGAAQVYVEEAEYGDARELIDADFSDIFLEEASSIDSATGRAGARAGAGAGRHNGHPGLRPVLLAASLLLVTSFALPHCGPAPAVHAR